MRERVYRSPRLPTRLTLRRSSYHLGRVSGIDVRLHGSFWLVPLLFLLQGVPLLTSLFFVALVFSCVFLHELGHSLVAQAHGVRVTDITLWPLGGMARMAEIPEDSAVEARIAIAGPLVNVVIALVLLPFSSSGFHLFGGGQGLIDTILVINLWLGLFNLIPAFPMDGGRLLRAWFARRQSWLVATERAVLVGRQLALAAVVVTIAACISSIGSDVRVPWMLPLIAGFVWYAGAQELFATRRRHMERQGMNFGNLSDLFRQAFEGRAPGGSPPPREPDTEAPPPTEPPRAQGGFSDDYIEELERYRGRLQRPPRES